MFKIIYDANNDNHADNNDHFDQIVNAAKHVNYDFHWHVYIVDDIKKISPYFKKMIRLMMIIFIRLIIMIFRWLIIIIRLMIMMMLISKSSGLFCIRRILERLCLLF